MINKDKLDQAIILTEPYEHVVVESGVHKGHPNLYSHLITCDEWDVDHTEHTESLFLLKRNNNTTEELQRMIEAYDWSHILDRMGVSYSKLVTSYQGTNLNHPLGRHTDEPEITGTVAKVLVYLTPDLDCGTRVHNKGNIIEAEGDTDVVKITPGAEGDVFLFKCSKTSFHSTDYSDVPEGTKRIVLTGTFHA
jgi:hypothetical protein|tara:strand:- start:9408 stop:9986 length:579 start_codon:yes stop_codon:yes gene_type:complete